MKFILKLFLFILLVLHCQSISAQITITTYYVIAPTSGCNGIWAIQSPPSLGCASAYFYTPSACIPCPSITPCSNIISDTMFIPICSLPCSLTVSGNGSVCNCFADLATGVAEIRSNKTFAIIGSANLSKTDPLCIKLLTVEKNINVKIYSTSGQKVLESTFNQRLKVDITLDNILTGIYYVVIAGNGWSEVKRIVVSD